MECPHVTQGQTVSLTLKDLTSIIKGGVKCEVCGAKESVWICVTCGQLNCGRYVKAHALSHYEKGLSDGNPHPVCLEVNELSVFCYACDDFIVNDTNDTKLDRMRGVLTKLQSSNGSNDSSRSTLDGGNSSEVTVKIASDESSTASPGNVNTRRNSRGNRRNRRSRSIDSDSTGVENNQPENKKVRKEKLVQKQELRNLVGLRNLGNTCFMSAVLQSLGNIHEFCRVLKQLPSLDLEELPKSGGSLSSSSSSSPLSNSSNGSNKSSRESRHKNGFSADGPIMTDELRKVLVALNQGPQQTSNKISNNTNNSNSSSNSSSSPSLSYSRKVISPEALFLVIWKVVPRFRGYQQQDAHEFLRYMLDRLHTELLSLLPGDLVNNSSKNSSSSSNRLASNSPYYRQRQQRPMLVHRGSGGLGDRSSSHSLVTQIFGGTLQSEVNCLVCNESSKKHDPFLDLSIDIPSSFLPYNRKGKDKASEGEEKAEKQTCHIYDCLHKFVEVEELADSERFFCNNCKNKQKSTKKFWVRRLPNVLCLHIKRFRWSPYSRTKLDTHVAFPLKGLDMSSYLLSNLHGTRCSNSGSSLYDLAAVIVHHGSGAGSGHYTAFVVKNDNWYHFNDSTVLATEPETVAQCKAYILFYIQREFTTPKMS